jgi:hypothetical protein
MDIRIYIRHLQMFNIYGTPIVYAGANPQSVTAINGVVPQSAWLDVTDDVGGRDKIKLTFTLDRDIHGVPTPGAFQPKKSVTNNLQIEGDAYRFIKAWCIDHVAAPLNAIDVRIQDTSCGDYLDYSIKSNQIAWCEDGICQFDVTLKQTDPLLQCIQKTLIGDNHQGWFQYQPAGGKMHPRFSYCNEIRPNSTLIIMWFLIRTFADIAYLLGVIFGTIYNSLVPLINSIIFIINIIDTIIGSGTTAYVNFVNPFGLFGDYFRILYIEAAGCGREHPAPLIRDYIKNVCDKCGVEVDEVTAPIFFSQTLTIQASTRFIENGQNPYYNACYLNAQVVRGIRRFRNNSFLSAAVPNNTDFFIPDNTPVETLDEMLDKMKEIFNSEWRLTAGKLYFWRRDWFLQGPAILDFTENGADRNKILEGVCFEWNEVKYPAYVKGLYSPDAADTCGNEALRQMNGYATFGNTDTNPNYEGALDKTSQHFGGTKFRLDGASTDYIFDAFQFLANGQIFSPSTIPQLKDVADWIQLYADYALLMKDETCTLPKILIWDGVSYLNAKAVRDTVPVNNYLVSVEPTPRINTRYNAQMFVSGLPYYEAWATRHPVENHVIGSVWTPGSVPVGIYEASDYFGSLIYHAAARLVNYPMYFEPGYEGTLWDLFHFIDDPRANPTMNANWRVKIEMCCEDLTKLQVLNDGQLVRLGYRVKLPIAYYQDGTIKEITVSYDSEDKFGKYIELKGTV